MAERDPVTSDSITTLIYVDMRGKTGGYRTDLLKEQVPENMRKLLICSKCNGISKEPKITESKTFCTNCTGDRGGEVDGRVEEFVRELKCRCPLSTRGCDWSGRLDNIEEHMNGCVKVKIKCKKGCGEVLQKCDTIDHEKECPFRNQRCEHCRKEVQANRANEHARICLDNPDGEVTCPYREVGCDTVGILRKDLETHITRNMISHQKLLRELNELRTGNEQLRNENIQLSDKMDKEEFETTSYLDRMNTTRSWSIWVIVLVIIGIAILVLKLNQQQIETSKLMEDKIDILKQHNTQKDSELKSIIEVLYSNISLSTGQLEWKIIGVKQKIQNKESTYSDPFYVGLYKCQGYILWNCLNTDKVAVFIFIMKGAYDDKLHWPIRYKFTFILLNHINSNNNYEYTNQVTKKDLENYPNSFKRPTELRNKGFGFDSFNSNTEILEAKYCKEDNITLLIKIELLPAL